jgi:hypothetical protein
LKRIRVESFAKTPSFLNSPRSYASRQPESERDNEFISLNMYNDEIRGEVLNRPVPRGIKLSQSSDEISKTVNVFFQQKASLLDPDIHHPSELTKYQQHYMPHSFFNR